MSEMAIDPGMVFLAGSTGMLLLAVGVVGFIFLYQRKLLKRKIAYQQIETLLHEQELKSAYAQLQGQDQERQRIARELHDSLGNLLQTLVLYNDLFARSQSAEEQRTLAGKISQVAHQAAEEARAISHRLDVVSLRHFGLRPALLDLVETVREARAVDIECTLDSEGALDYDTNFHIYRIVQELINNSLKHARASTLFLTLTEQNGHLQLSYADNGVGLNSTEKAKPGMGMHNILSRVEKLKGQAVVGPAESSFSIVIQIPRLA